MLETSRISASAVEEYLQAHQLRGQLASLSLESINEIPPSMFYFEDTANQNRAGVSLNIAFKTLGKAPVTLIMAKDAPDPDSFLHLLFGGKSYDWITKVLTILDSVELKMNKPGRANYVLSQRLKLLSVFLNIITRRLYILYPEPMKEFLKNLLMGQGDDSRIVKTGSMTSLNPLLSEEQLKTSPLFQQKMAHHMEEIAKKYSDCEPLMIGLPLLVSFWQVFECRARQWIGSSNLVKALLEEQRSVIASIIAVSDSERFEDYIDICSKRVSTTTMLLCDAVRFDETVIIPAVLQYIGRLGHNLELQQLATHDLSPLRLYENILAFRTEALKPNGDITQKVNNSLLVWLFTIKGFSRTQILDLWYTDQNAWPAKYELNKRLMLEYLQFLNLKQYVASEADLFDTHGIDKANQLYRTYYEVGWINTELK